MTQGWKESRKKTLTNKGIRDVAPKHYEVSHKNSLSTTLRQPLRLGDNTISFSNYTLELRNRDNLPQSEIDFIVNEIKNSLLYYNQALRSTYFRRLLKSTKDTSLLTINQSLPIYATIILVSNKKDSGHGVAGNGGFKMFASSIDMEIEAANCYTAIHEAHHAYGSLTEFDQGSMSAFFGFMITDSNDNLLRKRVSQQLVNDTFVHMSSPKSREGYMAKNRNHLKYLYYSHPVEFRKTLLSEGIPQDQIEKLEGTL